MRIKVNVLGDHLSLSCLVPDHYRNGLQRRHFPRCKKEGRHLVARSHKMDTRQLMRITSHFLTRKHSTVSMFVTKWGRLKPSRTSRFIASINIHSNVKGKAIPLQSRTGLEGSTRLRLPDFKTIGTHEGGKIVSPTHRPPLPPGNIPGTHFC